MKRWGRGYVMPDYSGWNRCGLEAMPNDRDNRIKSLEAEVKRLRGVLADIAKSEPRSIPCPDGIKGCCVMHTDGEQPLHSDTYMWKKANAALEDSK